jgi:AmiR/NasT family two-component response regulator
VAAQYDTVLQNVLAMCERPLTKLINWFRKNNSKSVVNRVAFNLKSKLRRKEQELRERLNELREVNQALHILLTTSQT